MLLAEATLLSSGDRFCSLFAQSTIFFKRGQKLCPNLLIKKKRIAQLINGKLDENPYNNTTNNIENPDQQKPSTYNYYKLTT
jgi:hypothetical protein